MSSPPSPGQSLGAAVLALSTLLAGCAHLTAKDLRQSSVAQRIAFEADEPVEEVLAVLNGIAPRCLRGESGVVAQEPGEQGSWHLTYGFTDFGDLVNTVTVTLAPMPGSRTGVTIHYIPNISGRWKRYAEKTKRWALRQADDCAF
jgi:hypothetical protein